MKHKLREHKGKIGKNAVTLEHFNIPLSVINRKCRQEKSARV